MRYIVHRGHRIYGENQIMGIRSVLDRDDWCEFDISYIQGNWILCHDPDTETMEHIYDLQQLIEILPPKGTLLIDMKWDFIWNRKDPIKDALHKLEQMVTQIRIPWMIQSGHASIVRLLLQHHPHWIIGYLMEQPCPILPVDFFMVNLSCFDLRDLENLRPHGKIYGYTCKHIKHLVYYRHLGFLSGIVIDIHESRDHRKTTVEDRLDHGGPGRGRSKTVIQT